MLRLGLTCWLVCLPALGMSGCFLDRSGTATGCESSLACGPDEQCVDMRCVGRVDAGYDAGPEDAGPRDAGPRDAGPEDAGPEDAGPQDAGPEDAGDAGVDGGPFVPRSIPGLVLWLRANTLPAGSVTTWPDESGANNHARATGTGVGILTATEGGQQVVRVDGTEHLRTPPILWGADATLFVVALVDVIDGTQFILSTDTRTHFGIMAFRPTNPSIAVVLNDARRETPIDVGMWHIFTVEGQTDTTTLSVDGEIRPRASHSTGISAELFPVGIGGRGNPSFRPNGQRMTGAFAEVLMWDVALTAGQRAQVESYLRGRWGGLSIPTP